MLRWRTGTAEQRAAASRDDATRRPETVSGNQPCSALRCSSLAGMPCSYVDRRGRRCKTAWCPADRSVVDGKIYCALHAHAMQALEWEFGAASHPDIDSRTVPVLQWISSAAADEVIATLNVFCALNGEMLVAEPVRRRFNPVSHSRVWEKQWKTLSATSVTLRVSISSDEDRPTEIHITVNGHDVNVVPPPFNRELSAPTASDLQWLDQEVLSPNQCRGCAMDDARPRKPGTSATSRWAAASKTWTPAWWRGRRRRALPWHLPRGTTSTTRRSTRFAALTFCTGSRRSRPSPSAPRRALRRSPARRDYARRVTRGPEADTELRVAASRDALVSASIIEEVAAWGASHGFPSWVPGSFTGLDSVGMSRLRSDIAAGGLYLVWRGDRPVATFSLLERDPIFWPFAGDDALYLHRFAVRRAGCRRRASRSRMVPPRGKQPRAVVRPPRLSRGQPRHTPILRAVRLHRCGRDRDRRDPVLPVRGARRRLTITPRRHG